MAPYVGPRFGERERLMFIGLDHGKDSGSCIDLRERQKHVLSHWRWNAHYWGCVRTAALLFGLDCTHRCKKACAENANNTLRGGQDCAVLHFIQANSVKGVPKGKETMSWEQAHKIPEDMPLLLDEIRLIRPKVIIVHGKDNHEPLKRTFAGNLHMTPDKPFGTLKWGGPDSFSTYIAFFRHPSRGWLNKDWNSIIEPTISKIKALPPLCY
jgi:hypothetical protein